MPLETSDHLDKLVGAIACLWLEDMASGAVGALLMRSKESRFHPINFCITV